MSTATLARRTALLLCALPLLEGCAVGTVMPRVDLKRMAYETLRREDCRLNQLEDFCQRTFANDYAEYERLRRDFERDRREGGGVPAFGGGEANGPER